MGAYWVLQNYLKYWKKEHQENGISVPRFLSSHPDSNNRISHLNEIAQAQGWIRQDEPKPIPGKILKKIVADKLQEKEGLNSDLANN